MLQLWAISAKLGNKIEMKSDQSILNIIGGVPFSTVMKRNKLIIVFLIHISPLLINEVCARPKSMLFAKNGETK